MNYKTFCIETFGCKMNKNDSELISAIYKTHGQFKGIEVTYEIIEKTASLVTGNDMKPFFNNYIYSDTRYDMNVYQVLLLKY